MQIYNAHNCKHAWIWCRGSRQVAWRGVLMIDIELGCEVEFYTTLKLYRDEQFLTETGKQLHTAGEL